MVVRQPHSKPNLCVLRVVVRQPHLQSKLCVLRVVEDIGYDWTINVSILIYVFYLILFIP